MLGIYWKVGDFQLGHTSFSLRPLGFCSCYRRSYRRSLKRSGQRDYEAAHYY
jgi:hypothetical protein